MNWQADPEIQRNIQEAAVRGRLLRSTLIWGPPFIVSLGSWLFFTYDRIFGGPDYGSTWFLVIVLTVLTGLFGFQAIQSFLDYIGKTRQYTGVVTRRWTRSDSLVLKTHYLRVDKLIFRGDELILDVIQEGDYVEASYYPRSAVLVWVEKREAPPEDTAAAALEDSEHRLKS